VVTTQVPRRISLAQMSVNCAVATSAGEKRPSHMIRRKLMLVDLMLLPIRVIDRMAPRCRWVPCALPVYFVLMGLGSMLIMLVGATIGGS